MARSVLPRIARNMFLAAGVLALLAAPAARAHAQAGAVNGAIEGNILDPSGAVLPGVTVTITNVDTGTQRVVVSNERGVYRAPILPLGTYNLVAELEGFRKFEQTGIVLSAGRTAVVNITLTVGQMSETVTVTAEAVLVDAGKIDVGRNMGEREVKNLPLVARNPYNFALLQPGVTGYENTEFGVPRFSANGTLLRINYQVDGNTNTQKDRAGLRLIPMSEVMISEVKVVTAGYAPEFGQTTGMVYNAITPSGTNTVKGATSFRFRRKPFSACPFFMQGCNSKTKPDTKINTFTGEVGGPVVKDRLHYFAGFERTFRDLSQQRIITVSPAIVAQVGRDPQPAFVPFNQTALFYIGKLDFQLNNSHRISGRFMRFTNDQPGNAGGGTSLLETTYDYLDTMNSTAVQVVSTLGATKLNELRVQYADRFTDRLLSEYSGNNQQIRITGVISFGKPFDIPSKFKQGILQVVDNFSWIRGSHAFKVGGDVQVVYDWRQTQETFDGTYTFPTIQAYLDAVSGARPYAHTTFSQTLGKPDYEFTSKLFSAFAQDDWRLTPDFKMLFGVRYDLYVYPKAKADSPFSYSQKFAIDKNNFAPRLGIVWALGESKRNVLRASTGIMYDQAMLGAYENALEQNGASERQTISCAPSATGCPAFPNALTTLPPGYQMPVQSIFAVDPKFKIGHTFQNNVQFEHAIGRSYSASVALVYTRGYDLPTVNNINVINPIGMLADGRPIFSTAVSPATRMDPRFNRISVVEANGWSSYKAVTFSLSRQARDLQFNVNYSYGKGIDAAPASGNLSFLSDSARSDPTNLERDKGPNLLDSRHNFNGSIVAQPTVNVGNKVLSAILNHNQVGVMIQLNSGLPFNISSNRDLNGDGNGSDRPLFVTRNSMYMPNRYNFDMRYSRFFPIRNAMRLEVIAEFKNVFNKEQLQSVNSSVQVNTLGEPLAPIPTSAWGFSNFSGFEQREFQLGFKFHF
ncbi:MAG: TonB-dependent receptor domain-containing protein [Vicinamibacterales bacterium]